jgi:hypothetical protein
MTMDYGYINARMRGMKSRLLSHRELDDLITKPDIESLIADLENSPYRNEVIEARGHLSGILCIEYALRENFTRTFRKIQDFARQEEADGPPLQEEGVDQGPALGVRGLPGPGQGLRRHLGLVQGEEDQAVGLGELLEEACLQEVVHEDPVQLGQPFRGVHHAYLPWALAAR